MSRLLELQAYCLHLHDTKGSLNEDGSGKCHEFSAYCMVSPETWEVNRKTPGLILCEGFAWFEKFQTMGSHAWLELSGEVLDPATSIIVPRADFYAVGRIQRKAQYNAMEVMRLLASSGHCGPWSFA